MTSNNMKTRTASVLVPPSVAARLSGLSEARIHVLLRTGEIASERIKNVLYVHLDDAERVAAEPENGKTPGTSDDRPGGSMIPNQLPAIL